MTPTPPKAHPVVGADQGITLSFTQKVIAGVTITALAGVLGMVFDARTKIAQQGVELRHLHDLIQAQMDDRYRGGDAARDLALRDGKIDGLRIMLDAMRRSVGDHHGLGGHAVMDRRVADLENRVEKLEGR